jgi:hypothetical protein
MLGLGLVMIMYIALPFEEQCDEGQLACNEVSPHT